MTYLYSY